MKTGPTEKSPSRFEGDERGDEAFLWLKANPSVLNRICKNSDLLEMTEGYGALSDLVKDFSVPVWAQTAHLSRSSRFFQQYTSEILAMLGLYALPYCYAGASGVRVLYHSKKIKEEPAKRLPETAQFVFDVCEPEGFSENGKALAAILKVRLMHAAARYYSRSVIGDEVPVNQEDMLGTMLAFSLIVLRGMRKMGVAVTEKEAGSYLHHWAVIGALMGVSEAYLPKSMRHASMIERQIRKREFRHSDEAEELSQVLVDYIRKQAPTVGVDPEDLMYYLLGSEVSGCIGIRQKSSINLALVELSGRIRNSFRIFSHKNYPFIVNQFQRTMERAEVRMT